MKSKLKLKKRKKRKYNLKLKKIKKLRNKKFVQPERAKILAPQIYKAVVN